MKMSGTTGYLCSLISESLAFFIKRCNNLRLITMGHNALFTCTENHSRCKERSLEHNFLCSFTSRSLLSKSEKDLTILNAITSFFHLFLIVYVN